MSNTYNSRLNDLVAAIERYRNTIDFFLDNKSDELIAACHAASNNPPAPTGPPEPRYIESEYEGRQVERTGPAVTLQEPSVSDRIAASLESIVHELREMNRK